MVSCPTELCLQVYQAGCCVVDHAKPLKFPVLVLGWRRPAQKLGAQDQAPHRFRSQLSVLVFELNKSRELLDFRVLGRKGGSISSLVWRPVGRFKRSQTWKTLNLSLMWLLLLLLLAPSKQCSFGSLFLNSAFRASTLTLLLLFIYLKCEPVLLLL